MSAAAKHTPGPWGAKLKNAPRAIKLKRDHWEIGQESAPRAGVGIAFGDDEANARLIAAAPELLEALKRIIPAARDSKHENFSTLDGIESTRTEMLQCAHAAIAKAEGRTQPGAGERTAATVLHE